MKETLHILVEELNTIYETSPINRGAVDAKMNEIREVFSLLMEEEDED